MTIDFQALEQALAPLAEIGQDEIEFPAGNTTVWLRVLIPSEERAVQRYSAGAIPSKKNGAEDDDDTQAAQEFLDRFRIEVIAYAIVQVGSMDLRGVETIATGEVLDNGKAVVIPKPQAMRKLIGKWTRPVIDSVFRKYGEAIEKVEAKATEAIQFEPSNIDTEIERLEARLTGLREERERRKHPSKSVFSSMMTMASDASHEDKRDREEGLSTLRAARAPVLESEAEAESLAAQPAPLEQPPEESPEVFGAVPAARPGRQSPPRQPVIPAGGAPPPRIDQPQAQPPVVPPAGAPNDPLAEFQDSFMDSGDAEGMAAAMAAEERRILARRRAQAQGQPPPPSLAVTDRLRTQQPRPPHQAAAEVERVEQAVAQGADLARASEVGQVGGVPAYRLPAQGMAHPAAPAAPAPKAAPDGGSKNPRFNPQR